LAKIRRAVAICELLEFRTLLSAQSFTINGVLPAAQDQPVIHAILKTSPNGSPLMGLGDAGNSTYDIQGYLDTGTSGVLLSAATVDPTSFNIPETTYNGQTITYNDTGVAGSQGFGVSGPFTISLAAANQGNISDILDSNPPPLPGDYNQTFNGIRTQISRDSSASFDIFGMPTMQGKVVVMDPTPLDHGGTNMSTYIYNPGTSFNAATSSTDPGIPATNLHIQLSNASFSQFETVTPTGAIGPLELANPFIGPNPVTALEPHAPADNTPPVTITQGSDTTTGSFLFDTGAGGSFISTSKAADLGVSYVPGTYNTDLPELQDSDGNPLADQFQAQISGVGGAITVAGFYMSSLTLQTVEGPTLTFTNAPVLVTDITVASPITHKTITLDGDFGMNYLVASFSTDFNNFGTAPGHFDWVTYDQSNGLLGLDLPNTVVTPFPTASTTPANVTTPGASSYNFTVKYAAPSVATLTTATINSSNLIVTGPHGFNQAATLVNQVTNSDGTISATYRITSPSGAWSLSADGDYKIMMQANQVGDSAGDFVAAGSLGTFSVAIAPASIPTTSGADTIYIQTDPNSIYTQVFMNTPTTGDPTYLFAPAALSPLTINTGGGSDNITVDFGWGNPLPASGLSFDGGSGVNSLTVLGTDGSDHFTVNGSTLTVGSESIAYVNTQSIVINGGDGNDDLEQTAQPAAPLSFSGTGQDTLTIDAGSYSFNGSADTSNLSVFDFGSILVNPAVGAGLIARPFAALTLGPGATATVANSTTSTDRMVLDLGGLTLSGSSRLDLGRNDLIVRNGNFSAITGQLTNGLNLIHGGYWNGNGIISSSAAADLSRLTTLGAMLNGNSVGDPLYPVFDGQGVSVADVLVKYTYYGDADLSGKVDGTDYSLIDHGFNAHSTGWSNGDFNYDGKIDGSDYSLIDNAFNLQSSPLPSPASLIASASTASDSTSTLSIPTDATKNRKHQSTSVKKAVAAIPPAPKPGPFSDTGIFNSSVDDLLNGSRQDRGHGKQKHGTGSEHTS
jgi:hypothetical protein